MVEMEALIQVPLNTVPLKIEFVTSPIIQLFKSSSILLGINKVVSATQKKAL